MGPSPPVRPPLEAAGKQELSPAEPAGPAPVPATSRVILTNEDGFGGGPESFPPRGFPRCPGGQTGPQPSIEEMPRPPSEQGTSSLPGVATDNVGYQTASSGSDEAVTGLLERYSGGHTPQDHTVASYSYSHPPTLNSRQPPALPPGAPTAAAQGLTLAHLPRNHRHVDVRYHPQFCHHNCV